MHKFIAVIFAFLMLVAFSAPASANNPWEGVFTKASKQGDVWTASVTIRATGAKLVKNFAECRRVSGGYECRNEVNSNAPAAGIEVEVSVAPRHNVDHDNVASGNTTTFAVFHPRHYPKYVPPGRGNVWNLDSEPQMSAACVNAGSHCIVVEAPFRNWQAAVRIAKSKTHWPL